MEENLGFDSLDVVLYLAGAMNDDYEEDFDESEIPDLFHYGSSLEIMWMLLSTLKKVQDMSEGFMECCGACLTGTTNFLYSKSKYWRNITV
jgi:hypothetical protein